MALGRKLIGARWNAMPRHGDSWTGWKGSDASIRSSDK